MPEEPGIIKLGLVSTIVDQASKPATEIQKSLLGMLDAGKKVETEMPSPDSSKGGWGLVANFGKSAMHKGITKTRKLMGDFIGRGKRSISGRLSSMFGGFFMMAKPTKLVAGMKKVGSSLKGITEKTGQVVKDFLTINKETSKFDRLLVGIGATVAGYIGFRALKAQMTDLVKLGAEYESQWMRIANTTGDPQFASGTREFINQATLEFPGIENTLYGISDSLAKMGVDFRQIGQEGVAGIASAASYLGDYKEDFQSAFDAIQNLAKSPGDMTSFMEQFTSVSSGMLQNLQLDTAGTTQSIADNMKSITGMLTQVYGDNLSRIADTTSTMTGKIRTRFEQFRETIIGVGTESGTLYSAYKKTLGRITSLIDNYGPQLTAFAKSIGKVMTSIWGTIDRWVGNLIGRFKEFLDSGGNKLDDFSKNKLMPVITYLAIVGKRAKSLMAGIWEGFTETLGFVGELISPVIDWITELSRKFFGFTDKLSKDKDTMKSIGKVIGVLAGGFLAFKGLSIILTPIIGVVGKLFALLGLGPAGLIVGAVAGIAFFYKAWTEDWGGIREKFAAAWDWIKEKLSNIGGQIKEWFDAIDWISVGDSLWKGLKKAFKFSLGMLTKGYNLGSKLFDAISNWVSGIDWGSIGVKIGEYFVEALKMIGGFIKSFFSDEGKEGASTASMLGESFLGFLKSAFKLVGSLALGVGKLGLGIVKGIVSSIVDSFKLGELWDKVKSAASDMIRKILPDWLAKKLGFEDAPVVGTTPGTYDKSITAKGESVPPEIPVSTRSYVETRGVAGRSTVSNISSTRRGGDTTFAPGSIIFNVSADEKDPKQFARESFEELENIRRDKLARQGVVDGG